MTTAKKIRLSRILDPVSKRAIIVPIDHGLTLGPIAGLESVRSMGKWLESEHINAIVAHKGVIVRLADADLLRGRGVLLHLNGMNQLSSHPDNKEMLTSLETAVRLGVDGVSMQINFTGENDSANWKMLGRVADQAQREGFPLMVMLYDKVRAPNGSQERLRQLLRVTMELGADAIKIAMPADIATLRQIIQPICEDVSLFLAGGELTDRDRLLRILSSAMDLGIAGVCMGRNVFAGEDSESFLRKLSPVVHGLRRWEVAHG